MVPEPVEIQEKHSTPTENLASNKKDGTVAVVVPEENQQETDVFEVLVEKVTVESKTELSLPADQDELKSKAVSLSTESATMMEPEKPSFSEVALKNDEINMLKAKLEEKEKELQVFCRENEGLKIEINEKLLELSSARSNGEEMTSRLNQAEQELEKSKTNVLQLNEKLEATERVKQELEAEMKKLHIHTEQWRKAADAAASVLAGGVEMNGRKLSERCGSMDKHYGNVFEPVDGYAGYVGSPGLIDDTDDVFGSGKRKGSGIRMFGDLWKKKGHK
ncbi:Interactor of constitutive active ROPs 4 [Abeliophyllum distichum]|uniref:Interactor of constitutive active ROPs 4 n=1 Tax=Abeliophyllum distichum TaxID=126358 RepID=A0ABD1QKV0_9LAMI